jgi:hypothetical protein
MDDLDALRRITAYIRLMRADLAADLDRMDYNDLARVVPRDEMTIAKDWLIEQDERSKG